MSEPSQPRRVRRFGVFQCDLDALELHKNGIKVKISDQPFHLLAVLLEHPGEMVTRKELGERLWPAGTYVGFDDSLNTAVNKLRAALDDEAENPRFIETIPRRGYRFIAPVEDVPETARSARPALQPGPVTELQASRPMASVSSPPGRLRQGAAMLALLLLVVAAGGGYAWWRIHEVVATAAGPPIRSLAVLPFANYSGDAGQDYFADGMTDELITDLAQVGSLRVVSRTSVMRYKGTHESARQLRRDLGVDAVIEGSVVRSGDSVRIDAQLIDTSDDRHLWAQSFTRKENDLVALQDDVAEAVAARVAVAVNPALRARLVKAQPVNAEAYDAYLHGISYLVNHSDADLLTSLKYFQQATAIDPTMAIAYAGTAQAYCNLGDYSVLPDRVAWPQAEMAAERAIAMDDSIGKAHAALAYALWRYEWNWKDAGPEFQRALALNPNDSNTHHLYALFLATQGDFRGAEEQLKTAAQLDPLSLIIRTNEGWLGYYQRDFAKAIADYQAVLQRDPGFAPAHQKLWIAYALEGDTGRAADELGEVFRLFHHDALEQHVSMPGLPANTSVRFQSAILAYANSGYVTSYERARMFAVIHQDRAALESLEEARSRRDTWLVYAGIEPAFESLHRFPQFRRLLADVGPPGSSPSH